MRRHGSAASTRDLVCAIKESVADSLIEPRQQSAARMSLIEHKGHVVACIKHKEPPP